MIKNYLKFLQEHCLPSQDLILSLNSFNLSQILKELGREFQRIQALKVIEFKPKRLVLVDGSFSKSVHRRL